MDSFKPQPLKQLAVKGEFAKFALRRRGDTTVYRNIFTGIWQTQLPSPFGTHTADEDKWSTASSEEDEDGQPVESPVSSGRLGADAEQQESEPGPPAPFEWAGP